MFFITILSQFNFLFRKSYGRSVCNLTCHINFRSACLRRSKVIIKWRSLNLLHKQLHCCNSEGLKNWCCEYHIGFDEFSRLHFPITSRSYIVTIPSLNAIISSHVSSQFLKKNTILWSVSNEFTRKFYNSLSLTQRIEAC